MLSTFHQEFFGILSQALAPTSINTFVCFCPGDYYCHPYVDSIGRYAHLNTKIHATLVFASGS